MKARSESQKSASSWSIGDRFKSPSEVAEEGREYALDPTQAGLQPRVCADVYVNMKASKKMGGGHVKTGAQKRLGTSASLHTNDIWAKTIGYDPYASEGRDWGPVEN